MPNTDEYYDIYDCTCKPTGRTWPRSVPRNPGDYARCVIMCIFNDQDQLLIQQRTDDKDYWQNMWDISAGGLIRAGETPQEGAMRELSEELGIDVDLTNIRPNFTTTFRSGFTDTFLINKNVPLSELVFQKEEVQNARYATKEEVLSMIEKGIFIPYRKSWIEFIWDMKDQTSVF